MNSEPVEKVPAKQLWDVRWPICASQCTLVGMLGVSECENMCPHKFVLPKVESCIVD